LSGSCAVERDSRAALDEGFRLTPRGVRALGQRDASNGDTVVQGGARIALDGELPLNTSGGQLSAGDCTATVSPRSRRGSCAAKAVIDR